MRAAPRQHDTPAPVVLAFSLFPLAVITLAPPFVVTAVRYGQSAYHQAPNFYLLI